MHARTLVALAPALAMSLALCSPAIAQNAPAKTGSTAAKTGGTAAKSTKPATPAGAQEASEAKVEDASLSPQEYMRTVAHNCMVEIALGKLAAERSEDAAVRALGHRLATNYTAIQVIAAKNARALNYELPTGLETEGRALVEQLKALQGTAFSKLYMMVMSERHTQELEMYRWQMEKCSVEAIKTFAAQTAPIISTHWRVADELNKEVNKEELRLAAERKAEEAKQQAMKQAQDTAAQAAHRDAVKKARSAPALK